MKVLLILVDGMRADSLAGIPQAQAIMKKSSYTLDARTVMPSVTLPCHMSLFHSVDPTRHGTTTNIYMPQVRPINGLCEVLHNSGKNCAFFYNWEALRDLSRTGSLAFSYFWKSGKCGHDVANDKVTDAAIEYLDQTETDFAFLYLEYVDAAGHMKGWMSDEYMKAMDNSWKNIERIMNTLSEDYTVIITADHGGHDRSHGTDMPEDMIIPLIIYGNDFKAGCQFSDVNIKDIAPTITRLLGVEPDAEWEGNSLIHS